MLFQLHPIVLVLGTDFSSVSLDYIQQQARHGSFGRQSHTKLPPQVKLLNTRADDFAAIGSAILMQ